MGCILSFLFLYDEVWIHFICNLELQLNMKDGMYWFYPCWHLRCNFFRLMTSRDILFRISCSLFECNHYLSTFTAQYLSVLFWYFYVDIRLLSYIISLLCTTCCGVVNPIASMLLQMLTSKHKHWFCILWN